MLLMINFMLSIIFMFMNHPLSMGLTLLLQTISVSMITGMLNSNFWFSYILFLIMIGGMLVLFIYMTSIASNEMFSYSNYLTMMIYLLIMLIPLWWMYSDLYYYNINFINMNPSLLINNSLNYSLTKYFNYPSMIIILFIIIYLFITLIAIVKITKIDYGPLRQKF